MELINERKDKEIQIYKNQINIISNKNEIYCKNKCLLCSQKNLVVTNFEYEFISSNNILKEINKEKEKIIIDNELLKQKMVILQLELNRQINKNEKLLKNTKNNQFNQYEKIKFNIDISENDINLNHINYNSENINNENNLINLNNNSTYDSKIKDIENKYNLELKEKDEEIEYLNNEIIELKTQLEEIEINKCNLSEREKEYEEIINDYESKIKFLKERNSFLEKKNYKLDFKECVVVCDKKYSELQWFLIMKTNSNSKKDNYEDYIWIDKLYLNENCFTDIFKNYKNNVGENNNLENLENKKTFVSKNNKNKDFSFCEQNSNLSK